jgi:uncharacterized membrane protein
MKIFLPAALIITTATITFWYADYTKKYQSLFLPAILNGLCYIVVAIIAYCYEGSSSINKLKSVFTEAYIIPYLVLNSAYVCFWYFLSIWKGAPYTGIYESTYILLLILMNVLFKAEKFNLQFFIGAILVCIGVIVIEKK